MKASQRFTLFIALFILAIGGLAAAQDAPVDPPSRVARLQFFEGQVSLQPGGVDDWVDASVNRPLTTADRIWTDERSRAELSIGSAALRLGSETSMTLTNLDDRMAQIELDQGSLYLSVRYLNPEDVIEVDTPNFAYTVYKPGEYRFKVDADEDQSRIMVRRGDGEATGDGDRAVAVSSGQFMLFNQGQSLTHSALDLPARDSWDDWCETRERQESSSASARYVAPGTVGYEDLDANGNWEPSQMYGAVWYPNVHPGWAPYHEGHWAWIEPWGYSWVDDAPWGFAPFHYGRWVNNGGRWGWVPGPREARPVYAPALVAWVGGGPGFGASFGIAGGGGVGWVALGWHDPYLPSYHVSAVYAQNVNISNSRVVNVTVVNNYYSTTNVTVRNTTVTNITYENARVNGALTVVPSGALASGRPVAQAAVVVPAGAAARVSFTATASVVPTKAAVLGGHAPAAVPAKLVAQRPVAAKTPPPQKPVSFEQQRPLLEKSNGVPLSTAARTELRKSAPPAPAPAARGGQPAGNPPAVKPAVANPPAGRPAAAPTPAANTSPKSAPVWTNDNIGHAPATNEGGKAVAPVHPASTPPAPAHEAVSERPASAPAPAPNKEAAPVHPASPTAVPAHEAAPAHPASPTAPAAHTAAPPATQPKNPPPPPKDNKDKNKKDKDKEPPK